MHKPIHNEEKEEKISMCSPQMALVCDPDVEGIIDRFQEYLEASLDQFTQRGSGWTLSHINSLEIRIGKYFQDQGGCSDEKLPLNLASKRACISLDCQTDCFKWSILACLHPAEHNPQRFRQYRRFAHLYDFSGVEKICKIENIRIFELKNEVSVSVYTIAGKSIIPLRVSRDRKENHANLLLYKEHYYPIRDFNKLCARGGDEWRRHWCDNCLCGFREKSILEKHIADCYKFSPQRIELPMKQCVKFDQYHKMLKSPFVIYADFETLVVKKNGNTSYEPCSFGLIVVDWRGEIIKHMFFRGRDSAVIFIEYIAILYDSLMDIYYENRKPLILSDEDWEKFKNSSQCYLCKNQFHSEDEKVADHDHLSGEFRGATHNSCNLNLREKGKIPIIFHNLKNFDSHLLVQGINSTLVKKIRVVPQSIERFIALKIDNYIVLDSFGFLPSSLDVLSENTDENRKQKLLGFFFENTTLLRKKGVLPYEYLDCWEKFDERKLPSRESFFSTLKNEGISEENYENVKLIWKTHECQNLGELHDIYLKVDVCLLGAVFEQFREMSLVQFGLEPCHFFSSPGLT